MPNARLATIPIDFSTLRAGYPTFKKLPKHISDYMDSLNKGIAPGKPKNTPCCFQISEALNKAGAEHRVPPRSFWRANTKLGDYYYLGAVNELESYLATRYGKGEELQVLAAGAKDRVKAMKAAITGRSGIICFRDNGAGAHTELWDGTDIVQNGAPASDGSALLGSYIWGQPRIVFWGVTGEDNRAPAPNWLTGWWEVNDGTQYYYYFSDQYVVHWTKTEPERPTTVPGRTATNEGSFTLTPGASEVHVSWNPMGDGITEEFFTYFGYQPNLMTGLSNRYAPLVAVKKTEWKKK